MNIAKIKSSNNFHNGIFYEVTIEQSYIGAGNIHFPTRIVIHADGGTNDFIVKNDKENTLEIEAGGEWETSILPDVFRWIGNELEKINFELREEHSK